MATKLSKQMTLRQPSLSAFGPNDLVASAAEIALTSIAANDLLDMLVVPDGHVVVDCLIESADLDTNGTPTITLQAGFLTGTPGDIVGVRALNAADVFINTNTVAQAGGVARRDSAASVNQYASTSERSFGIKCVAGAATFAAGTVRLTVMYRPQRDGM